MTYDTLLASASNHWPSQELSGDLIDTNSGENLVPSGGPTYGLPGPRPWLPRAVSVDAAQSWTRNAYAGLNGVLDYTLAVWIRKTAETGGWRQIMLISPSILNLGLTPTDVQYAVNDGATVQQINLTFGTAWTLATYRRFDAGPIFRGGRDVIFQSTPTTPNALLTGLLTVGGNAMGMEMAGMTTWQTSLSDADIETWFLGPSPAPTEIDRRSRGSGKIRRPGRRR